MEGIAMKPSKLNQWKLSSLSGALAIVSFFAFTTVSALLFKGSFSPVVNYISDLGSSALNPGGALIFDAGLALTGLFTILFFTGLYTWKIAGQWKLTGARLLGVLAGFALILVGVFSEDSGKTHALVATVFFISLIVAILATDFVLRKHPAFPKLLGYYGVAVALCSAVYIGSYLLDRTIIISEWITVIGALGWMGLLAYRMLREAPAAGVREKVSETLTR